MPDIVYTDNHLPIEYGVAYRRAVLREAGDTTTVVMPFIASNFEEAKEMLQSIMHLKQAGVIAKSSAPFKALHASGLVDKEGKAVEDLQARLGNKPKLELIYKVNDTHYAAISLSETGITYVDSKGAACPNHANPSESRETLPGALRSFWGGFYGVTDAFYEEEAVKEPDGGASAESKRKINQRVNQRLGQRLQEVAHFHNASSKDVEQQESHDDDSLGWVLANLDVLNKNIAAKPSELKSAEKIKRADMVDVLNTAPDPRNPPNNFELVYQPISKDEPMWERWRVRYRRVLERCEAIKEAAEAEAEYVKANPGTKLSVRASVSIEMPDYLDPDELQKKVKKLNEYPTKHPNGITNHVKIEEKKVVVQSKGGVEPSYYKRFSAMAKDFDCISDARPVVVINVHPPDKKEECKKALEDYFGVGNVRFENENPASTSSASSTGITARPGPGAGA